MKIDIRLPRWPVATVLCGLLVSSASAASQATPVDVESFSFLQGVEGVHQSQVVVTTDGTLLLVWVQKGTEGLDLLAATRPLSGSFSAPQRVNQAPVNAYTGDEARPDVALGPDGAVAIAWTAGDMTMMLAVGKVDGPSFSAPVRLNQDDAKAARTMPVVAFSSDGAAHAVWLDAREAPPRREEPAELYYARVDEGRVEERNLTAEQKASVCGCCRPFIAIDDEDRIEIAFRNTTEQGYRDIFLIAGDSDGEFSQPRPTSGPIWEIRGCPSVGPVVIDGLALWKDGSKNFWRLLSAADPGSEPVTVIEDTEGVSTLTFAPRRVSGSETLVLVGGKPRGFLLERSDFGWDVVSDDLPEWASSAALVGAALVLVGNDDGTLRVERMPM